ncbi:MAG: SdrD B-like domain-containing protein [Balneolaceae bacterium]
MGFKKSNITGKMLSVFSLIILLSTSIASTSLSDSESEKGLEITPNVEKSNELLEAEEFFRFRRACEDLPTLSFDFATATRLAGTGTPTVGTIYKYFDVTGDGTTDAEIKIINISNARIINFDQSTTGTAQNFQPQIAPNVTGIGSQGFIDFEFTFFQNGSSILRDFIDFTASAVDVDGDAVQTREFVGFQNLEAFTVEATNALTPGFSNVYFTFESTTEDNVPNIDPNATTNLVYTTYETVSRFKIRAGVKDAFSTTGAGAERLFSFNFDPCLIENFNNPVTTNVFDLEIRKKVDEKSPDTGEQIKYTVVVQNKDNNTNATGVFVTDNLPSGLTYVSHTVTQGTYNSGNGIWNLGLVPFQISDTLTINATVNTGTEGNKITNVATISAFEGQDRNISNNTTSASLTVRNPAGASCQDPPLFAFTNSTLEQGSALLTGAVYRFSNVDTGVDALVTIENRVNATVTSINNNLTDPFQPSIRRQSSSNAYVDFSIQFVQSGTGFPITYDEIPVSGVDIDGTGSGTLRDYVGFADFLSYTIEQFGSELTQSTSGDYTIFTANNATNATGGQVDTDNVVYTIYKSTSTVKIRAGISNASVNTTVPVIFDFTECVIENFDSPTTTNVSTDLQIVKTVDDNNPTERDNIEFTLELDNLGPLTATGIVVKDSLPDGFTLINGTVSQGTFNPTTGEWAVGTVISGSDATLTLNYSVDEQSADITLRNYAFIKELNQNDINSANDTSFVDVDVVTNPDADIEVFKSITNSTTSTIQFELKATNNGPVTATNVFVKDSLTTALTFVSVGSGSDGSFTSGTGIWDVGTIAVNDTSTIILNYITASIVSGENYAFLQSLDQDDIQINNDTTSVPFTFNTFISGTVFEDITGDELTDGDTNFNDASGDQQALSGVEVHLYRDLNNGGLGTSENYIGTTTTDGNGNYLFEVPANDTYWIVVDSQTGEMTDGTTWPDQTYGAAGAVCADGAGGTSSPSTSAGPCYGGRNGATSDDIPNTPVDGSINTAEHIIEVLIAGNNSVSDIDFGFSFNVVTNIDDADEDGSSARWHQGSFRQFAFNANQIDGDNEMRFVPAVAANQSTWWRITLNGTLMPTMIDGGTTFDGTAYNFQDPDQIRDTNTGTVGGDGGTISTVGTDAVSFSYFNRKELDINTNDDPVFLINSPEGNITIRELGMYNGFGGFDEEMIQIQNNPGGIIEDNFIGPFADGTTPAGNTRGNIGIFINDSNNSFSIDILNNYIGFLRRTGIHSENEDVFITVRGNEIFENSLDADSDTDGISGTGNWTIEENLIRDIGTTSSSAFDGGSGIEIGRDGDTSPASGTISNNTIFDNQSTGISVIEDVNGLTISENIITGNGVQFAADGNPKSGAGIKLINSDGQREITGVTISQNQISGNEGLGIDISESNTVADGVSANDGTIDTDFTSSPNGLVDYPIITSVATNGTVINITGYVGTDASRINETFTIEVFKANNDGDNAGEIEEGDAQSVAHGEGEFYIESTVSNPSGEFSSQLIIPGGVSLVSGDFITVTATDDDGNTSEFSANYEVGELDIEITKILLNSSPIPQDEEVTFLIIAENKGPTDATGVTVTDALTAQLTLDAGNTSATTGSYAGNTWTIGNMASGQIDTLTLVADPNTTGTGLSNTATLLNVNEDDLNTDNNSSTVNFDIATIIRGTVFEDITGDGITDGDTNFGDASGDQRALSGVEVHLYRDLNNGGLGTSENYIETVLTDANGVFSFAPPANDDYWVVVDSRSAGLSDGTTWAEQVYGPIGALCADGTGGTATERTTAGVCYGGRRANTSDLISTNPVDGDIANAEHIAAITYTGTSITQIDFGFSYNVMSNVLDDADDDGSATRWIQGSMRQFFLNANQISSANAMRFVPAVADNDVNGNGWGILAITSAFPALTDGSTTVDGTAYDFQNPDQVLDNNSGSIGTGGTVGVDALSLPTFEDKELEINGSDFTFITINSTSGNIIIKELAIVNGSTTGAIVVSENPGGSIEDNYIGIRNDGTTPADPERNQVGIFFDGTAIFSSTITRNYFGHHRDSGIECENENAIINITQNEIFRMGRAINEADGISGVAEWFIEGNLIHRNGRAASSSSEGGAGIEIGRDNEVDEATGTVINNTILDNFNVGINIYDYALNVTIEKNIITQNGEDGTATGAGIKLINPDNERNIGGILITKNSFFDNEGLAIDIVEGTAQTTVNGVTPNDGTVSTDFATNPNGAIDYPVIDSLTITGNQLTIRGYVGTSGNSINDVFSIELYKANDDGDNDGEIESGDALSVAHGEGETYITTIFTASDGTFLETFTIPGSVALSVGDFISSLAMDGEDNTSEFSANYDIQSSGGTISGFVYQDDNHNGQRENGEDGISGVTIVLRNSTSGICRSVSTDANGLYQFLAVEPETYTIVESASETTPTPAVCPSPEEDPTGYVSTTENTINLVVGGGTIQNQDFGNFLGFRLDGTVFQDDGLTGGTANNAIQDGEEAGLGEVTVTLTDNSDVAIQLTATDEDGNYSFWITEAEAANGSTLKIKQLNLTSYLSTGGNEGTTSGTYNRSTDVITFVNTSGVTYTGANFADVPQNRLITDGVQFAQPGTSVFFTHQFDANSDGTVTFTLTNTPTPSNANWPTLLYLDDNCNGEINPGEEIITAPRAMTRGESICLIVRTSVPIGVPDGGENAIIVQADFSFANASPALDQTYKRNDRVTVGEDVTAGLKITKIVDEGQALPGENLTYTITYINNGDDPISTMEVKDSTPAYTTFVSASFSSLASLSLTGCTITAPIVGESGGVIWTFTGTLDPGQTGTVTYTVKIDE